MAFSDLLGFAGTLLIIVAYAPQIWHLYKEKCSEGVSENAWELWFVASLLLLFHAFAIGDLAFIVLQLVNLLAIAAIIILVRANEGHACSSCMARLGSYARNHARKHYRNRKS